MGAKRTHDFNLMLAQRILYQLHRNNLFTPVGKTVDETSVTIHRAEEMVATMLENGEESRP